MILPHPEDMVNIVVRAVIIQQNHLWVSEWDDGRAFLIGGRLEHGEVPDQALLREIREETGARAEISRFLGVGDVVWTNRHKRHVHEYGWYFAVHLLGPIPDLGTRLPNPDHHALHTAWLPLDQVAERVRPRLVHHLITDASGPRAGAGFRYFTERDGLVTEPLSSWLPS